MPNCHKCQYNGKSNPICLTCPGPSETPNNHGHTHVSIDAATNESDGGSYGANLASLAIFNKDITSESSEDINNAINKCVDDRLKILLCKIQAMSPEWLTLFFALMHPSRTRNQTAVHLGLTTRQLRGKIDTMHTKYEFTKSVISRYM